MGHPKPHQVASSLPGISPLGHLPRLWPQASNPPSIISNLHIHGTLYCIITLDIHHRYYCHTPRHSSLSPRQSLGTIITSRSLRILPVLPCPGSSPDADTTTDRLYCVSYVQYQYSTTTTDYHRISTQPRQLGRCASLPATSSGET